MTNRWLHIWAYVAIVVPGLVYIYQHDYTRMPYWRRGAGLRVAAHGAVLLTTLLQMGIVMVASAYCLERD